MTGDKNLRRGAGPAFRSSRLVGAAILMIAVAACTGATRPSIEPPTRQEPGVRSRTSGTLAPSAASPDDLAELSPTPPRSATPALPPAASSLSPTPASTPTLLPGPAPPLPRLEAVQFITHGDRDIPLVALTFDVGQRPSDPAGFDRGIYDALVQRQAPATFFLGGDWMRTHITQTRLLDSTSGFELGNHSWSHPDMRSLNEPEMARELLRTQEMLFRITGHQTSLFRLPSGLYNDLVLSVAAYHGLYVIQWDVVTGDPVWDNSAENIAKLVRERVQNGSIIVMHANGRGWHTAEALPAIIEYLRAEGYCLVTVSQLIGLEPLPPDCPATSGDGP